MIGARNQITLVCTPFISDALGGTSAREAAISDWKRLSRIDRDLDCGIQPENVAIFSTMFRVPMPNPSPDLTDKVKAALLSQVSEIANQVCDSMLVTGAAVPLKNRDGLGGPGNVIGFIGHAIFLDSAIKGVKR